MSGAILRPADLRLIHLVAARRRGLPAPAIDDAGLSALLDQVAASEGAQPTAPFQVAAAIAQGVMRLLDGGLGRQVALLALCCQLRLEGYQLTAPQGVLAGMVDGMSRGRLDVAGMARWLEDRALLLGNG